MDFYKGRLGEFGQADLSQDMKNIGKITKEVGPFFQISENSIWNNTGSC